MRRRGNVAIIALALCGAALPVPAQQPPATPAPAAAPAPEKKAEVAAAEKKPAAPTSLQIKAGDAVFRFGVLLQGQADWTELPAGGYAQNLFLRRARLIVGGQVTKNVYFFFQTENSRLGAVNPSGSKVISSGFQVLDAVAEWRIDKAFNLWGGLIYVPTGREALKSSSSEFMIDTSAWAYVATTALTGTGGRDTGFMARGYFLGDHLEYRAGLFQGLRDTASRNPFRFVGRLQYNFFDTEVYNLPAYTASYFGSKRILAVGAAYDSQKEYEGVTADVYADFPVPFGSVVGTASYHHLDGGKTVTALKKQDLWAIDAGFFFKGAKLGPWARYEDRSISGDDANSQSRVQLGLNYYPFGNNLNLKAAWGLISPKTGGDLNQVTIQLQAYFF